MARYNKFQKSEKQGAAFQWKEGDAPIPIYADYEFLIKGLNCPRFKFVDKWEDAKIFWLYSEYEEKRFLTWGFDESDKYVSWWKKDGAMCAKNDIAHLVNTTL